MKYRGLIFDLDGTLVDSLQDLGESVNAILIRKGMEPHPMTAYRQFVGNGVKVLLQKAFGFAKEDQVSESLLAEFKTEYQERMLNHTPLYEGITDWLQFCKEKKIRVGVFTNKPESAAIRILESRISPEWMPDPIFGAKEGRARKPEADGVNEILSIWGYDASECLFIGDSDVDMITAENANMDALAAGWGFRGEEELLPYAPRFYAPTAKAAKELFISIFNEECV